LDANTLAALVFEAEGTIRREHLVVVGAQGQGRLACDSYRPWRTRRRQHSLWRQCHCAARETILKVAALTNYSQDLTFNVGTVSGGTVLNRVPHEAMAEGEFRAFNPEIFKNWEKCPARPGRAW